MTKIEITKLEEKLVKQEEYCQPQAKAKAKAMPGRLYIHTK